MTRIYVPSGGPQAWQSLLAQPQRHWRTGFSAKALAHCWEVATGLPPEIASNLTIGDTRPELLFALPEHKVPLPGSALGASQSDLFALVRAGETSLAVTVEGKVDESFDKPLSEWLLNASPGKVERLAYILGKLGLKRSAVPETVHYQLLHRSAAALIEPIVSKRMLPPWSSIPFLLAVVGSKNSRHTLRSSASVPSRTNSS